MQETYFFKVIVRASYTDEKGREKFKNHPYIVEAVNPTDAEVKINQELKDFTAFEGFTVTSIKQEKIVDIIR